VRRQTAEVLASAWPNCEKAAGYSQRDLAAEIGISQRIVAYYETQSDYLPTHLFTVLAKALGVSADQLLGIEKLKKVAGRATIAFGGDSVRSRSFPCLSASKFSNSSTPSSKEKSSDSPDEPVVTQECGMARIGLVGRWQAISHPSSWNDHRSSSS